jgi:hypothetical protein
MHKWCLRARHQWTPEPCRRRKRRRLLKSTKCTASPLQKSTLLEWLYQELLHSHRTIWRNQSVFGRTQRSKKGSRKRNTAQLLADVQLQLIMTFADQEAPVKHLPMCTKMGESESRRKNRAQLITDLPLPLIVTFAN